jgi:CBS domain-containing protein
MDSVIDQTDSTPIWGGDAPALVYAADEVITMLPDATLRAMADELARDGIGLIVIGTRTEVHGVISERDVVGAVSGSLDFATTLARDVASPKVVWCDDSATVREASELMMEHYVRHVLLEVDGRLVGIVSARDLLGAFTMSPV